MMKKPIFYETSLKPYREQAIWFLNNCVQLQNDEASAEMVYKIHQHCEKLDPLHSQGHGLSELQAHLVLEHAQSPITQVELRSFITKLKGKQEDSSGGTHDTTTDQVNHRHETIVSLVELLICYFNLEVDADNYWIKNGDTPPPASEEETKTYFLSHDIIHASRVLQEAKNALEEALKKRAIVIQNETNAKMAVDIATREQEEAEHQYQISLQEQELANHAKQLADEALIHVKEEENAYKFQMQELKSKATNESLGIVQRNRAKAEYAALQTKDPLPLRKARIENEHAIKKLEKVTERSNVSLKMAQESQQKAIVSAKKARDAQDLAMVASTEAEYAIPIAQEKLDHCKILLEELIAKQANCFGTIFYIDRELKEASKFLPRQKLGHLMKVAEETKKQLTSPSKCIG